MQTAPPLQHKSARARRRNDGTASAWTQRSKAPETRRTDAVLISLRSLRNTSFIKSVWPYGAVEGREGSFDLPSLSGAGAGGRGV